MRLRLSIILITVVIGVGGIWAIQRAISQYVDVTEAITKVEIEYLPDSFVWLDPAFDEGRAQVQITNRSDRLVTVEHLELNLYFDGQFAGSWYEPWEATRVAPGKTMTFDVTYQVTSNSIQDQGAVANLSTRGITKLTYHDIGEPFTIRLSGTIGQVTEIES